MNPIDGVIFGGLPAVPVPDPIGPWLRADRIDPNAFSSVMKRWRSGRALASLIPDFNRISVRGVAA